jgi:hypothetical protein
LVRPNAANLECVAGEDKWERRLKEAGMATRRRWMPVPPKPPRRSSPIISSRLSNPEPMSLCRPGTLHLCNGEAVFLFDERYSPDLSPYFSEHVVSSLKIQSEYGIYHRTGKEIVCLTGMCFSVPARGNILGLKNDGQGQNRIEGTKENIFSSCESFYQ